MAGQFHDLNEFHKAFSKDLTEVFQRHENTVNRIEMLAILSNFVGKIIALQGGSIPPRVAMETVMQNIQAGNAEMMEFIMKNSVANIDPANEKPI